MPRPKKKIQIAALSFFDDTDCDAINFVAKSEPLEEPGDQVDIKSECESEIDESADNTSVCEISDDDDYKPSDDDDSATADVTSTIVPKPEVESENDNDSLDGFLNSKDKFYAEVNNDEQQNDDDSSMDVGIEHSSGEVKSEPVSSDDNDPILTTSSTHEVVEHHDRMMALRDEIQQNDELDNEHISGDRTPSNSEQSSPRRFTVITGPSGQKVVQLIGNPLMVRSGQLHSRLIPGSDGSPRRVMVVRTADIRNNNNSQTSFHVRTPLSMSRISHETQTSPSISRSIQNQFATHYSTTPISSSIDRRMVANNVHSGGNCGPCLHCVHEYNQSYHREPPKLPRKPPSWPPSRLLPQKPAKPPKPTKSEKAAAIASRLMQKKKVVQVCLCRCCNRAFASKRDRARHEKANSNEKPFKCRSCGKGFKTAYTCKMHEQVHNENKTFQCQHCPKMFKTANSMRNHQVVHSNVRRFPCSFCQKLFKTQHCRRVHEITHADKVIECSFCPRTFKNDDYRKKHERLHTNDRPYKCEQCDAAFTRIAALRIHEVCHANERKIKCRFCEKRFNRKEHCQRHEKIHLNDRQFVCSKCPKRFITSWKCKRHELTHLRKTREEDEEEEDWSSDDS